MFFTGRGLISVAPENGQVLWQHPWTTRHDVNAATPVFIPPGRFFISSGYGTGGTVVEVSATEGGYSVKEVWRNREMKNHFATSIYYEGHLYGFDASILKCIDAGTGAEKWKSRGYGKGTLIAADGHLVILGERGNLGVAEATPAGFVEKAGFPRSQGPLLDGAHPGRWPSLPPRRTGNRLPQPGGGRPMSISPDRGDRRG